jgi:phage RecT family recombinase
MEQQLNKPAAPSQQQVVSVNTKKEVAAAIGNSGIADSILASFDKLAQQGQLVFPKGYALGNQLKLMYANISQNGNVTKATPISIGESLANAAIQGLEIDKSQVYFIVYDRKMSMFRSYFGDVAVAKRSRLVKEISARVIYQGDEYEIETNDEGKEFVTGHRSSLANRDNPIEGAYAWAVLPDGRREYCIMTWKEIQKNWSKSKAPGTQKDFPQEMSKRTVIRRLVKMIFNTAPTDLDDEAKAIVGSYNRTTKDEYIDETDYSKGGTKQAQTTVSNSIIEEEETPFIEGDEPVADGDGVIDADGKGDEDGSLPF